MAMRNSIWGKLQMWLCLGKSEWPYVALAAAGLLPIFVASILRLSDLGVVHERSWFEGRVPAGSVVSGFTHKTNWLMYPLALPAAFFLLRFALRTLLVWNGPGRAWFQVGQPERYSQIIQRLRQIEGDGWAVKWAFYLNLAVTLVDKTPVVIGRYLKSGAEVVPPGGCDGLDWGWMYLTDSSIPIRSILALDALATAEQFLLTWMALVLLLMMYRCNRAYLQSILLKSRRHLSDGLFRLGFHSDLRFGLSGLSGIFNMQLAIVAVSGLFVLASRYANVCINESERLRLIAIANELSVSNLIELGFVIMPDPGQWMLIIAWGMLFLVALMPAQVKLLPLKDGVKAKDALAYLEEFSFESETLASAKDVERVAANFRRHSFWPSGEPAARFFVFWSALVFIFMVFPVRLNGTTPIVFLTGIVACAGAATFGIFVYHAFRLRLVSEELADPVRLPRLW